MEFYATCRAAPAISQLQQDLPIARLSEACDSIDSILEDQGQRGRIYCLWGEFDIQREALRKGLRFSLLNCPHSLAWTITRDEESPDSLRIHCTITTQQPDPDFSESIQQFVDDWAAGLERRYARV